MKAAQHYPCVPWIDIMSRREFGHGQRRTGMIIAVNSRQGCSDIARHTTVDTVHWCRYYIVDGTYNKTRLPWYAFISICVGRRQYIPAGVLCRQLVTRWGRPTKQLAQSPSSCSITCELLIPGQASKKLMTRWTLKLQRPCMLSS